MDEDLVLGIIPARHYDPDEAWLDAYDGLHPPAVSTPADLDAAERQLCEEMRRRTAAGQSQIFPPRRALMHDAPPPIAKAA